jgi:hypothetical protein
MCVCLSARRCHPVDCEPPLSVDYEHKYKKYTV